MAESGAPSLISATEAVTQFDRLAFVEVLPWREWPADVDTAPGSIPGAHIAGVRSAFAGTQTGSSGHLPLPEREGLRSRASLWSDSGRRRIVVYSRRRADFTSATRAWFALAWAGVPASVLDGALPAWVSAGGTLGAAHPESIGAPAPIAQRSESTHESPQVTVLDSDEVAEFARYGTLLDARSDEGYHGVVGRPHTGHIPGALHAPATELLDDDGFLRSPYELRRWFLARRALGSHEVGAYCGGGIASSALVFAAALLGQQVALYVDSWTAWEKDSARPVEQGVPRVRPSDYDLDCIGDA